MTRKYKTREYTIPAVERLAASRRTLLFADVGMGKTSLILAAAVARNKFIEPVFPMLLVSTKRVVRHTWAPEAAAWEFSKHLRCQLISGTPQERIKQLAAEADIYMINFDLIPWLVKLPTQLKRFRSLVVDESTRLASHRVFYALDKETGKLKLHPPRGGGKQSNALAYHIAPAVDWFVGATGTPVVEGLQKLWGQAWFCDFGNSLGRTHTEFMAYFFFRRSLCGKEEVQPWAEERAMQLIAPYTIMLRAEDYFDLKKPRYAKQFVHLEDEEMKAYKKFERKQLLELRDAKGELTEIQFEQLALHKVEKLCQYAAGFIIPPKPDGDAPTPPPIPVHDHKIEACLELIEEIGRPVLIAYFYKYSKAKLVENIPGIRFIEESDVAAADDWNAGKVPVLGLHLMAGHGLNLQHGGHDIIFYDMRWSAELFVQIINRIGAMRQLQSGYDRIVNIYPLLTKGTADELVYAAVKDKMRKEDVFKSLFDLPTTD